MARKAPLVSNSLTSKRRRYPEEFRREAVQMLLDGHSAASVAERLGVSSVTLLYRWKQQLLDRGGPVATTLDERVRKLEAELLRVERERDVLPLNTSIHFRLFSSVFQMIGTDVKILIRLGTRRLFAAFFQRFRLISFA